MTRGVRRTPEQVFLDSISERDWQAQVIQLAETFGYAWGHFRPAQTSRGWRTPVSGPLGEGWPDLMLARPGRFILAECKRQRGEVSTAQAVVHALLRDAGVEVYVWRPGDLDAVAAVLRT